MLADYFTKPLQGGLSKRMQAVIMGWTDIYTLREGYNAHMDEERDEITDNGNLQNVSKFDVMNETKHKTYAEVVNNKG